MSRYCHDEDAMDSREAQWEQYWYLRDMGLIDPDEEDDESCGVEALTAAERNSFSRPR